MLRYITLSANGLYYQVGSQNIYMWRQAQCLGEKNFEGVGSMGSESAVIHSNGHSKLCYHNIIKVGSLNLKPAPTPALTLIDLILISYSTQFPNE